VYASGMTSGLIYLACSGEGKVVSLVLGPVLGSGTVSRGCLVRIGIGGKLNDDLADARLPYWSDGACWAWKLLAAAVCWDILCSESP